jgi:hypothetical protein
MNSIFIYVFFEIVVSRWLGNYFDVIINGIISPIGFSKNFIIFNVEIVNKEANQK